MEDGWEYGGERRCESCGKVSTYVAQSGFNFASFGNDEALDPAKGWLQMLSDMHIFLTVRQCGQKRGEFSHTRKCKRE